MIKLKDILAIASANTFRIKNLDTNKIVWKGSKSDEGYEEMEREYAEHYVVAMIARGAGRANYGGNAILTIEVQWAWT